MKVVSLGIATAGIGLLLLAFSPEMASAYPKTKDECDAAGGTWATNGDSGFCYLKLDPMISAAPKDCKSAGGVILTTKNGQKVCGKQRRGISIPLKGLGLLKPDTK